MAPPEARVIASEHPDKVRMLVLEVGKEATEAGMLAEVLTDG
jgi:hypothetical protein